MIQIVYFITINVIIPLILSCYYSWNPQKNQLNYDLTKGSYYCVYGIFVCIDYLVEGRLNNLQSAIAGLAIVLAMFEGIPLVLKPLLGCIKHNNKK